MTGPLLVLLTVLFTVYGQLAIKWRISCAGAMPAGLPGKLRFLLHLLADPWIISAFAAAFLAALCWIGALTRLELSRAYPFMALNFILVAISANWLFGEPVTWPKIAGLVLITLGLVVGSFA